MNKRGLRHQQSIMYGIYLGTDSTKSSEKAI